MLKVKKITVENFRGIKLPVALDFYKGGNPSSVVIYGRNGTGKSTIVDAWEWLNSFKIQDLEKEGISAKDYPHKTSTGENTYIEVEFNHGSITSAGAKFNKAKITSPSTTGQYAEFRPYTVYPNYLRYSDLQEFVFMTKTKKYEYIAKFFGLEKFTKNQSDIQASLTRLKNKLETHESVLGKSKGLITSITGNETTDNTVVIAYINGIAAKHGIAPITEFKDAFTVRDALDKIVRENPVARAIAEWLAFQARLNQFYPVAAMKVDCEALEASFAELKKDESNISQLFLAELYDLTIKTIGKLADKTVCPVCDQTYSGNLVEHVTEKHKALKELNDKKSAFDALRNALERRFDSLSKRVHAIQGESSAVALATFKDFFETLSEIAIELPTIVMEIKTPLKDIQSIAFSSSTTVAKIDKIGTDEMANKKLVADQLILLNADEKTKNLGSDFANLSQLITGYADYLKADGKVNYLQLICKDLESLFSQLTLYIQSQIQSTFASIQADVIDCYNFLESSNIFLRNPEIKIVAGKDKAVELEIEFVGEKVTPAYKFMSESQVNSFGLAIFLSAVKHFNGGFKFIILDDVVNSFDAFKRPRVAQLLATRFSDFQFLILTHDQVFFDTVQRAFPNWQRYKFVSWDFATGPKFRLSKNYSEDIQSFLDDDEPIKAGQTLGRYLEWMLGNVNETMQTPIRYKVENVYTLAEFYDPLVKRFKDKLKKPGATHKLVQAFGEIEQGTLFRNYCAHWKDEAIPFTSPEIDGVFKKWLEIEKFLYCDECKSNVQFESDSGTEYIKCSCGSLDLKTDSYYS